MDESRATDVQAHTSTLAVTRFFRPLAVSTNCQEPATLPFRDCLPFARTNFVLSFSAGPSLTDTSRTLACSALACFSVSICFSARSQSRRRRGGATGRQWRKEKRSEKEREGLNCGRGRREEVEALARTLFLFFFVFLFIGSAA